MESTERVVTRPARGFSPSCGSGPATSGLGLGQVGSLGGEVGGIDEGRSEVGTGADEEGGAGRDTEVETDEEVPLGTARLGSVIEGVGAGSAGKGAGAERTEAVVIGERAGTEEGGGLDLFGRVRRGADSAAETGWAAGLEEGLGRNFRNEDWVYGVK